MDHNGTKKIAGAFLVGGIIGAAAALLYAPKSGRETRKYLTKAAKRMKNDAFDLAEDTVEKVSDLLADVKDKATDLIDQGRDMTEESKKEIIATLDHGQKVLEKQKKKIMSALGM